MISVLAPNGDVAMLRLEHGRIGGRGYQSGLAAVKGAVSAGARAIILDMGTAQDLRPSDMARLVELAAAAMPQARLSLVNVVPSLFAALQDQMLDQVVPVFTTLDRALQSADIREGLLASTPAVVLSAGKGTRMSPITRTICKPMLDVMGRPILEHILRHLRSFGVRCAYLNPGHLGLQIPKHFGAGHIVDQSLFYLNEGKSRGQRWVAEPIGSASTLARLAHDHNALSVDTIVMCGDALADIDLAKMMDLHKRTDADVTIAGQSVPEHRVHKYGIVVADQSGSITEFQEKPALLQARSRLANTGIYILSPRVARYLDARNGADIANDLLPAILADGGRLQLFEEPFQWVDIGCGRDYMAATRLALSRDINSLRETVGFGADLIELKPEVWAHPTAHVERLRDIDGPAYIGQGCHIHKGAALRGPLSFGAGCKVERGGFVRNSAILAGTSVGRNVVVDGMIASGEWAVAHAFATGETQPSHPIPGVHSLPDRWSQLTQSRIAGPEIPQLARAV